MLASESVAKVLMFMEGNLCWENSRSRAQWTRLRDVSVIDRSKDPIERGAGIRSRFSGFPLGQFFGVTFRPELAAEPSELLPPKSASLPSSSAAAEALPPLTCFSRMRRIMPCS